MIFVQLNKEGFEYDIHSLVKAFYPPENVCVYAGIKELPEPVHLYIRTEYQEDAVTLALKEPPADETAFPADFSKWKIAGEAAFPIDFSRRRDAKNRLKQELYRLLSDYTGKTLPWGTLTGIRPTKIPMDMLENGRPESEIKAYMSETYFTSEQKIDLSIDIARRELRLLQKLDYAKGFSLYIGIPFCPSTCLYCSFTSFPFSAWKEQADAYLDALEKELAYTAEQFTDRHLNCIYIGGGTPTTLSPGQLERLFCIIEKRFDLSCLLEFTVEAGRPDSITREKCQVLRAHGISRISINPQTMKQETLDLIGRHHTTAQTVECFYMARELGFDNINMDLIMGLPQETLQDVQHTMEILKELSPDNITVHSLAVKRAARLNIYKDKYRDFKMVNTQEHLDAAARACREIGMQPYYLYRQKNMAGNFENIGYAKTGRAGIYNILIMEEKQMIIACGAGSISKRAAPGEKIRRCANVKDAAQYIDRIDEMIERKRIFLKN